MRLRVTAKFTYAVNGYTVTDFKPSDNDRETDSQDVPDDAAQYALSNEFAEQVDEEGKSIAKSPENKARKNGKGK